MREGDKYQEKFLEILKKKIPHGMTLINTLVDILNVDKDSAYRRLRGETPFSFHEILSIAQNTGISLDNVIGTAYGQNLLFRLPMIDYIRLADSDYQMLDNYLKILKLSHLDNYSEFAESSNSLPMGLYLDYPCLTRFYMFKWRYRNSVTTDVMPYSQVKIPKKLEQVFSEYQACSKHISTTHYLWDSSIFRYLMADIKFLSDMKLITDGDISLIKCELMSLLQYVDNLCETGQYEETGNKISFHIIDINQGITCSYLDLFSYQLSVLKAFTLNVIMSSEKEVFYKVKELISSLKQMSVSITGANNNQKKEFISTQREILGLI